MEAPVQNFEAIKDGLKILAIFVPLLYFFIKGKSIIVKDKRLLLLIFGFLVLLFGWCIDFAGDFKELDNVFLFGQKFPYHERAEDIVGVIGFILFSLGIGVEIKYINDENREKKKMIQRLEEQANHLRKFDTLKSKFVEDVSHEFCSPLSSVVLTLSNVVDGLMGEVSDEQKEALNIGKKNLNRLSKLVTDMLTLSKIEEGKTVMRRGVNDISLLVDEAHMALKAVFDNNNISFNKISYIEDSKIWCDGDKIIQVLINIISNGLKYSPSNTQINVRISGEDNEICLEIEDQGKGMSQEDIEKLFNRFERLKAEKEDGTGLGLVIAKEIMDLHKGKILIQSKINEGTRFVLTLPRDIRK
jgi:signal transduction histidine kinase